METMMNQPIHQRISSIATFAIGVFLACAQPAPAITAVDLKASLDAGEAITVIDLRANDAYRNAHIPGAINIHHRIIPKKKLPRLGRVVAYGDGVGDAFVEGCVADLNAKTGIEAEVLEGGFAAWRGSVKIDTAGAGLVNPPREPIITYQRLLKTLGRNVVIVDLCKQAGGGGKGDAESHQAAGEEGDASGELKRFCRHDLPGANISHNPSGLLRRIKEDPTGAGPLIVLVDDDNRSAIEAARRMHAAGYKRAVALAGGAEIIRRRGKSGFKRVGGVLPLQFRNESRRKGGETTGHPGSISIRDDSQSNSDDAQKK